VVRITRYETKQNPKCKNVQYLIGYLDWKDELVVTKVEWKRENVYKDD